MQPLSKLQIIWADSALPTQASFEAQAAAAAALRLPLDQETLGDLRKCPDRREREGGSPRVCHGNALQLCPPQRVEF